MPDDITPPSPSAASEQTAAVETQHSESTRAQDVEPVSGELPTAPSGYELLEEVGRGGMGVVFRARDLVMNRDVAVKLLREDVSPDSPSVRRFLEEARVTGRLQHPGIPPVHQVGTLPDGRPFLAMKLIRGRTLADMLNDLESDRSFLVASFERICEAVGYAHSEGIIHRDLKPANVMVGAFGEVQVMDWGLAHSTKAEGGRRKAEDSTEEDQGSDSALRPPPSAFQTTAGAILGTPAYMAPEQARGEPVDCRADVFALGGVLCAIITGKAPFLGADSRSVLEFAAAGNLTDTFARLDASGGEAELIALCKRCLAPNTADRPEDAKVVADAVAGLRAAAENRARRAEAQQAAAEVRADEQWKRRQTQFALAVMVMCFIITGGLFAWWNEKRKAERLAREREDEFATKQRDAEEKNRRKQHRNAAITLLLECEMALKANDIPKAELALAAAAKRVQESGDEQLNAGLARCRGDLGMLQDLDQVEKLRHTVVDGMIPSPAVLHREWATAYGRFGIVLGTTPAVEDAELIHESLVGDQMITGLDSWLRVTRNAALLPILHAADPDEFRDGIREALATGNNYRVTMLSAKPDALTQPARFAAVLGVYPGIERERRKRILLTALERHPNEFAVLLELGWISPLDTPVGLAEREGWYRAALVVRPAHPTAWNNLGNVLQTRGDLESAVFAQRKAIELDPGFAAAHNNLGNTLKLKGDLDGAIAELREAVRLDPKYAVAWRNLGNTFVAKKEFAAAQTAYREALKLDPDSTVTLNQIGEALLRSSDWSEAAKIFREGIKIDPTVAGLHNGLGIALARGGVARGEELDAAIEAFRKAARLDPQYQQNLDVSLKLRPVVAPAPRQPKR